jgi:hypothetical protein
MSGMCCELVMRQNIPSFVTMLIDEEAAGVEVPHKIVINRLLDK